jgi:hypothetical protein
MATDIDKACQKKPGVDQMATVCESCLETAIVDEKPLFSQETDGLKYRARVSILCKCDGMREHDFILKPNENGHIALCIGWSA